MGGTGLAAILHAEDLSTGNRSRLTTRTQCKTKEKENGKQTKQKREISELRNVTRSSVVCKTVVAVKRYGDSATVFWNPHGVFKYWRRLYVADTGKHRVKR